jgi:hypothetical protein
LGTGQETPTLFATMTPAANGPHDIAVDDVAIYWTNYSGGTVTFLVR